MAAEEHPSDDDADDGEGVPDGISAPPDVVHGAGSVAADGGDGGDAHGGNPSGHGLTAVNETMLPWSESAASFPLIF
ncbi:hypothetical protein ZWY2020_044530 [Hordeum vulgare]|nr:hypothetical protein ZWY2020_044530 [Hordeum vulgare]